LIIKKIKVEIFISNILEVKISVCQENESDFYYTEVYFFTLNRSEKVPNFLEYELILI